ENEFNSPSSRSLFSYPALAAGLAIVANTLILSPTPLILKAVATLVLTGMLPGALFIACLLTSANDAPSLCEQSIYSAGAGYTSMVLTTLLLSYLPGSLTQQVTLLAFNLLIALLTVLLWLNRRIAAQPSAARNSQFIIFRNRWLFL